MNEPSFPRFPDHHLDPSAQEFLPAVGVHSFATPIYYPFPPPAYDSMGYTHPQFASPPAYVNATSDAPPPVSLPPSSTTPSRTLLLSMVPVSVSESTVRRDLEIFGDVRAVQMERCREGLVTVHFYDLRDSQAALLAIQEQHMHQQCRLGRHYDAVLSSSIVFMAGAPPLPPPAAPGLIQGRVVWAQFTTPVTSALPDGNNLGSLVIFNLDPMVSPTYLQENLESFGPVKEMRETPKKRHQRFVEFFDVRNAAKAMAGMNGKEICGKNIVIEYSRPGGQTKKFYRNPQNVLNSSSSRCLPLPPSSPSSPPQPEMERRNSGRCAPPLSHHLRNHNGSGGSKSSRSGSLSSLNGSVANLCINGYEECSSVEQCSKKKSGSNRINGDGDENLKPPSSRPWKGGGGRQQGKDCDPRFLINEDAIMESNCSESRTTVMIKNIPNKYSQKLLLNMLDNHCIHCNEQIGDDQPLKINGTICNLDRNKCNVGYGFVNMTTPQATLRLYKAFHHQNWEVFNSRKICDVTYARLQGLEALREHFKNSKFPGDAEEYMPVVFMPPRDGGRLTEPVPIVGRVHEILATLPQSELIYDSEDRFSEGGAAEEMALSLSKRLELVTGKNSQ